ncbi:Nitrate reductase [NADH] 1, partial [Turnera subulata]
VVPAARSVALVPGEKIPCKLVKKKESLSHDVRLFRFALPSEDQVLGLPVGKHRFLCAIVDEKLCMRAYTPTSTVDVVGYFDLVIQVYFKNGGGLMSQHLDSLELGSFIDVKGSPKFAKKLTMLSGGTGITPIYQVIQAILKDPEDQTEMYVVYANRTEDDILLRREELDPWAKEHERLKVWYVVQASVKEGWQYSVGFITENILREHVPEGSDDTIL